MIVKSVSDTFQYDTKINWGFVGIGMIKVTYKYTITKCMVPLVKFQKSDGIMILM